MRSDDRSALYSRIERVRELEREAAQITNDPFAQDMARRETDRAVSSALDYVDAMIARMRSSVDRIP